MSLTLSLLTARSGLLASQAGLDIIANNIVNANTEGYSRKIANFEQRIVEGNGAGVQISEITRVVDENLLKSMRIESGNMAELEVQLDYYEQLQNLFGEPGENNSISHLVEELTFAVETLATSPERTFEQSEVVRRAKEISVNLELMTNTLQELREQADVALADVVTQVNNITAEIEDLNNKIVRNQSVGNDITDLLDKRDQALDDLSEYMDIQYFTGSDNRVIVFTEGGYSLVDATARTMTHVASSELDATVTHAKGNINGIFLSGDGTSTIDITNDITRGEIKGLIELRDNILPDLQAQLDTLAADLRDTYNQIHNRGAPYPGMTSATGTRTFVNPGTQTMTLSGGDVTVALTDTTGAQVSVTTLNTIMQDATLGTGAQTSFGAWNVTEIAATIEDWIQANGGGTSDTVSVNSAGNFEISIGSSNLGLVFRDETATVNGSTSSDITIQYDVNGDSTIDYSESGFSSFLGLNDFFIDGLDRTRWDTEIKDENYAFTPSVGINMMFTDADNGTESITLLGGTAYELQDIADLINDDDDGISFVTATVYPEGAGFRLRLEHDDGQVFEVHDDQGTGATNSFVDNLGFDMSNARAAQFFQVREDILTSPGLQSTGILKWDEDLGANGEYFLSVGDNTISQALGEMLTTPQSFDATGGLFDQTSTFSEFGNAIVSFNSGLVASTERVFDSQTQLTEALTAQADNVSGVNLDEEMSMLLIFQQSYSAAARVINVVQDMFEDLESAIR